MDPTEAEPLVGEIRAVRTFRVGPAGELLPLTVATPWTAATTTAVCATGASHVAPDPDCTCGLYAYAGPPTAAEQAHAVHVLAVVAVWGHVVLGTRGLRAQHARVEAVWFSAAVPDDLVAAVGRRYARVEVHRDRAAMLAAHPPTRLDTYEPVPAAPGRARTAAWRAAALTALGLGTSAGPWLDSVTLVAVSVAAAALVVGAVVLARPWAGDHNAGRRGLALAAAAVWCLAPVGGLAVLVLVRTAVLVVGGLGAAQLWRLRVDAATFPSPDTGPRRPA
ncbi:hypothetical protein ACXR2U_17760 [Jatrophihabitans sp. YIM 134969]